MDTECYSVEPPLGAEPGTHPHEACMLARTSPRLSQLHNKNFNLFTEIQFPYFYTHEEFKSNVGQDLAM